MSSNDIFEVQYTPRIHIAIFVWRGKGSMFIIKWRSSLPHGVRKAYEAVRSTGTYKESRKRIMIMINNDVYVGQRIWGSWTRK